MYCGNGAPDAACHLAAMQLQSCHFLKLMHQADSPGSLRSSLPSGISHSTPVAAASVEEGVNTGHFMHATPQTEPNGDACISTTSCCSSSGM